MLDFCYTEQYFVYSQNSKQFLIHAQMYTMADKYGITRLKSCTGHNLSRGAHSICKIASKASTSVADLNDMLAAISHIYRNTQENDALRMAVVRCPWDSDLLQKHKEEWTSFLVDTPEYACDMTLYCNEKLERYEVFNEQLTEFVCPGCKEECIISASDPQNRVYTCVACFETYDWKSGNCCVPSEQPGSRSDDCEYWL